MKKYRLINRFIPLPVCHFANLQIRRWKRLSRWLWILLGGTPVQNQIRVFYGHDYVPHSDEPAHGGIVKFQRMQDDFPNSPRRFNILYMVSSWRPKDWSQLLWLVRQKKAKIVWNQNGVAYPAWRKVGWEKINAPMAKLLHAADYVFYQSRFCKLSADRFLGERREGYEILYNAVDTKVFTPASLDPDPHHLIVLLGGTQYQYYRIESAIRALAVLAKRRSDVRLLITGKLSWISKKVEATRIVRRLLTDLGISDKVQFLGAYTQQEAPSILRQAHILLHTKYNDPCPGLVVEAMACGLPVVYSHSGGVPELVGQEAGIGIPAEISWEQDFPPDPEALAEAVLQVAERRTAFAEAARQRAVEQFDLCSWLQRHREVFEELMEK
jgi:glycosyltransferase involved in cell wall biosynthesis